MNRSIAFNTSSKDLRYVVLEGTLSQPKFVDRKRFKYPEGAEHGALMGAVGAEVEEALATYKPDIARLRFSIGRGITTQTVCSMYHPQGIIFYLCEKCQIPHDEINTLRLKPKLVGFPESKDLETFIDMRFGEHPPFWDKVTREVALAAWSALEKGN